MQPILEIKGISKKFRIRHENQPYLSMRDSISNVFKGKKNESSEEFWALRNISFNVNPGDSIGIIGKNGAGKSTLLKILSKITPPTEGRIISRGRIASLLEVGTGFHPELSGRENVFLNGSILGMKRKEIISKFDEIIEFSGVEKFIDTPLKHYSSGMQLRLAFAVAAFLEPEILVIDEVLAVGDAEFQKKCIGKMEEVSKSGRTILFVSHSMASIQNLCKQAILISEGHTKGLTSTQAAIQEYLYGESLSASTEIFNKNPKQSEVYFTEAKLLDEQGNTRNKFKTSEQVLIEMTWVNEIGVPINASIEIARHDGIQVMRAYDAPIDIDGTKKKEKGTYKSTAIIPAYLLNASDFFIRIALYQPTPFKGHDLKINILHFSIYDSIDEENIARGNFTIHHDNYVLLPKLNWKTNKID